MRRIFALLLGLSAASPAWAVGVGSTYAFGGLGLGGNAFDLGLGLGYQGFGPSLDLHFEPFVIQIHVLELITTVADSELYLGANGYYQVHEADLGGAMTGVVQPGVSLDLWGDPTIIAIAAECRLGGQLKSAAGLGVYVVPSFGIVAGDGDAELFGGGALQISAWFGG